VEYRISNEQPVFFILFIIVALIFNPFIKFHFQAYQWHIISFMTLILFIFHFLKIKKTNFLNNSLLKAAKTSNISRINFIMFCMFCDANVDYSDIKGNTPLLLALEQNDFQTADLLLSQWHAKLPPKSERFFSALKQIIKSGNTELLSLLLKHGLSGNTYDENKETLWSYIWEDEDYKRIQIIKCLIKHKAQINTYENIYFSPLSEAIAKQDLFMIDFLLDNGAAINFKDKNGETVLCRAAYRHGNHDDYIIDYLLKRGAKFDAQSIDSLLCAYQAYGIRKKLIEKYIPLVDLNEPISDGSYLIMMPQAHKDFDLFMSLINNGAKKDVCDAYNNNLLMRVIGFVKYTENEYEDGDTVLKIINGKKVEPEVLDGWAKLKNKKNDNIITFIFDNTQDINHTNLSGQTALMLASIGSNAAIVSKLIKSGADLLIKDKNNCMAHTYAILLGDIKTIKLLLEKTNSLNKLDKKIWFNLKKLASLRSKKCKNEIFKVIETLEH